jgi:hypothetical protein
LEGFWLWLLLLTAKCTAAAATHVSSTNRAATHTTTTHGIVVISWALIVHISAALAAALAAALTAAASAASHIIILGRHITEVVVSGRADTMRGPIELEVTIIVSRYFLSIEGLKDISGGLKICKLDEAITDRFVGYFVFDQFDTGDCSNFIELHGDIVLVHPVKNIADPE